MLMKHVVSHEQGPNRKGSLSHCLGLLMFSPRNSFCCSRRTLLCRYSNNVKASENLVQYHNSTHVIVLKVRTNGSHRLQGRVYGSRHVPGELKPGSLWLKRGMFYVYALPTRAGRKAVCGF